MQYFSPELRRKRKCFGPSIRPASLIVPAWDNTSLRLYGQETVNGLFQKKPFHFCQPFNGNSLIHDLVYFSHVNKRTQYERPEFPHKSETLPRLVNFVFVYSKFVYKVKHVYIQLKCTNKNFL